MDLHLLFLVNPDQPARSCKYELKQMHGIDVSDGTMSQWFRRNKQCKGVFVKTTCGFSDLKFTEENVACYNLFKERIISSLCHNNVTLSDEKLFTLKHLLKLRVRKDPVTGEVLTFFHESGVSVRKRHNMFCTIRPLLIVTATRH